MDLLAGLPARVSNPVVKMLESGTTPNLEAGALRTLGRAPDTRPVMHLWQHLPVTNRQRPGWRARLHPAMRPATNCRVWLELVNDQGRILFAKGGAAIFGTGIAGPVEEFTIGRNETAHIPLYLHLRTPVQAFWVPGGGQVEAGTYVTSADFLYRTDLIGSLLVPMGSYTIRVQVEHDDGKFEAPPIPLVVP